MNHLKSAEMRINPIQPSLDDLIRLSQPSATLKLARPTQRALNSGQYLSRFKGRGMEFDETRPYTPGDDVRHLDWKVIARTSKPHTKLFREERERPVFLTVDYRAAMFFATRGVFKSVMAARLAALIGWAALHHGDRVGGQIFSESAYWDVKPGHGRKSVLRLLQELVIRARPGDRSDQNGSALRDALNRLPQHAKPGSLFFIFSDFRQLNNDCEAAISRLARHSDGVLVLIHDALELNLPSGRHRYSHDGRNLLVDAGFEVQSAHLNRFLARQEKVKELAQRHGLRFINCSTQDDPLLILQQSGRLSHPSRTS